MTTNELPRLPLIGSIQNTVGMGFIGNQAVFAVANALGARAAAAPTSYASAHSGMLGRVTAGVDAQQFTKDVAFLISQQPAVLIIGYVPKPNLADIIANQLTDYKGIVLLDPVIGDYQKGLYVTAETARAIRDYLLPAAQIVTPNRFEAEVLLGIAAGESLTEYGLLNGIFDLGPQAVVVTSFEREPAKRRVKLLFTNGYTYARIAAPFYPMFPAHGVGDVFAAAVGSFVAIGGSPFAGALLATALCARAVANTTHYGGNCVDPVAALEKWKPIGYQLEDERAMQFVAGTNIEAELLKPGNDDAARLKFAPPKNKIVYG